jgi:hypothetical protein
MIPEPAASANPAQESAEDGRYNRIIAIAVENLGVSPGRSRRSGLDVEDACGVS